jgi:hypothetical protein
MQITDEVTSEEKAKNSDFELAETKATKAIQKHSMNIDGRERNFQIDEAYLLWVNQILRSKIYSIRRIQLYI